jgi:two-component system, LytTR family, response regulator LytT
VIIRIMIAEDERLAREELTYLLTQENDIELLPSAANGRELLQFVEEHQPDVVFLDIHMPDIEGIQAARMLASRKSCPLIVFSTAHEDYAVEAFDLNAVDYLLKPYDHHRLHETLNRIRARMKPEGTPDGPERAIAQKIPKLLIDDGNRLVVIDPETIFYAVREERVIEIHTTSQVYTSKMTLQQLEEKLVGYSFFRTHRSYLVNTNYMLELVPWFNGTYNLIINDAKRTQIPVSRSSAKELFNRLQG